MLNTINNISFKSKYPVKEIKQAISHFKYQDDFIRKLKAKKKLQFFVQDGALFAKNNFMMPKVKEAKGVCHELSKLTEHYLEKLFPEFYFYRVKGNEEKFFNRGNYTNHYFNIGMHKDDNRLLDVFFDAINKKTPKIPEGSLIVDSSFGVVTENPTHKLTGIVNPFVKPSMTQVVLRVEDTSNSMPVGFLKDVLEKPARRDLDDILLYYNLAKKPNEVGQFNFRLNVKKAYNQRLMILDNWQKIVNSLPEEHFLKVFVNHMKKYDFINFV